MKQMFITACGALLLMAMGGASAPPTAPVQASAAPSVQQCFAGVADNVVFFTGCAANERFCPNSASLGVSSCIRLTDAEIAEREQSAFRAAATSRAQAIIEQDNQRRVEAEVLRLGEHRRAEALRRVQQQIAAETARRQHEDAAALAERLAAMTPQARQAYETCRALAANGRVTCQ